MIPLQALRDTDRLVQYNLRNKQFSTVLTILTQVVSAPSPAHPFVNVRSHPFINC